MTPSDAMAHAAIRDLVARYNAGGDSGRVAEVVALFWPDAEMEVGGPGAPVVRRGPDEIASIFTGAAGTFRRTSQDAASAPVARHHVRHFVATHVIDLVDDDHATGYAYYQVLMPHGLDHWGRYFDHYERRDGEWRFLRRKVTRDGVRS